MAKILSLAVAFFLMIQPGLAKAEHAIEVGVNGMVCAFCAQGIEKKFKAEDSIDNVHVDLDNKQVHLGFKKGQSLEDDKIHQIITDAGYVVTGINRKFGHEAE